MKKIYLLIACLVIQHYHFAQELSQSDFDKINDDIKSTLFSVNDSDDIHLLNDKFNLTASDSIQISDLIANNKIKFTKTRESKSHIMPFYYLTNHPNEIKLTIFSLTVEPKRDNEKFNRGKYYFILTSKVRIQNEKIIFSDTKIKTQSKAINSWFLENYPIYLENTNPVFKKYNYRPPPPLLPPTTLK